MPHCNQVEEDREEARIKNLILRARKWACLHFNANPDGTPKAEDTLLDGTTCFVEFPDVDRMTVQVSLYGRRAGPIVSYRLLFGQGDRIAWVGQVGLNQARLDVPEVV